MTRLAYLFTPWRRVLALGAIAWCVVLNVLYVSGGATNEWLGAASVVPLWAMLVDVLVRDARWRRDHA